MKRFYIAVFALLLVLSQAGCQEKQFLYEVSWYGTDYQINTQEKTVSGPVHSYPYEYEGDSSNFYITFTYPNGATYWYRQSGGSGSAGWSSNYDESAYVSGDTLVDMVCKVLEQQPQRRIGPGRILAALLLAGFGIFSIACPQTVWYWESGWRYKDAEPSDTALSVARISGAAALIIGIIIVLC